MFPKRADVYRIVVIVDKKKDKVIGTGTLFVEKKFLRQTGIVTLRSFAHRIYSVDILRISQWTSLTEVRNSELS